MYYKRNEDLEYIEADDTSLAVFDSNTGTVHFFDETGVDILNILSTPHTLQDLLNELCNIYAAEPKMISRDLDQFLTEAVSKKVVRIL